MTQNRAAGTATTTAWEGVYAILPTPFLEDGALDENGLRANCRFLEESPVDVVVTLGSEGEFYALTAPERKQVNLIVVQALKGRKPVVCGVSDSSSRASAQLAKDAAAAGADAVMSLPPYFVRPRLAEVTAHFAAVADAGLPVFVYNSPGRTGYGLSPDDLHSLKREVPGIIGVKQAAADLSELAALVAAHQIEHIVGGAEVVFWPALCAGACGSTATAASALPGPFAAMWAAFRGGDLVEGGGIYTSLEPLREAYRLAGGQAAVVKRLASMLGLAGGPVRPPLAPAPPAVDGLLRALLEVHTEPAATDRAN